MDPTRQAGEPERSRRPAGAPEEEHGHAGAPPQREAGERGETEGKRGADAERAQVERDLDELLAETRRERDEYLELAQRTRADFENYRRRVARDAEEAERRGKSNLARALIPVLDNLERALRAAGVDPDAGEPEDEMKAEPSGEDGGLPYGVRLVYRELRSTLEGTGVETYDPIGEKFDPIWHEAMATRSQEEAEPGVVLETVEKGYRLDGQVLRAARVVVSE